MEEIDLVIQLKNRNEQSFQSVVDKYQKMILNSCYKFVNNKETAEDLTQDVFIQVYKSIDLFRNDSKLSTWIYKIAVHKSLDYLRKNRRRKGLAAILNIFDNGIDLDFPANDFVDPLKNLENTDRSNILNAALEKLPEKQRVAFTLSNCEELSYKEIAEIMGTSVSSVESLIFRARTKLKSNLFNYYKGFMQ